MNRIIYDPVSWIHPQRFTVPDMFSSARCCSILNDNLLSNYKLSTGMLNYNNSKEKYLAHHWHILSKASYMAVCQRYRSSLAYQGSFIKLDDVTRKFAQSRLIDSKDEFRGEIDISQLWGAACQELIAFSASVSTVMKERIPLLFPESLETNGSFLSQSSDNELLLRMAIQHASRNI